MRNLMARLLLENSQATPRIATSPSRPVKRPILSNDLENQFAFFGPLRGDVESILHFFGGFFHPVFLGVIQPAQDAAGLHLFASLDFQDDARRLDLLSPPSYRGRRQSCWRRCQCPRRRSSSHNRRAAKRFRARPWRWATARNYPAPAGCRPAQPPRP